jgi:drug/metabolite transporter (DMT)-like permease
LLRGNPTRQRDQGALWGILTGVFIATYTVIDGWAIKALGMQPVLFYSAGLLLRTLLLAPFALHQSAGLRDQWQTHRWAIVLVGVLSPMAYLLVLLALQTTPLSYVAPVRAFLCWSARFWVQSCSKRL